MVVTPAADTMISLMDTLRLAAEAHDANGHTVERVQSFAWSSGDASVATVDGTGLATAVGSGAVAISAEAEGVSGSATLTVAQVVTEVVLAPAADTLASLGDTVRLAAEARDANGHAVKRVQSFAWSSGDSSVATVDGAGLATAVENGTAAIEAEAEGVSGSASLTVAQVVSEVVLAPATDTLVSLGDTVRLAAEAQDANGHAVERVQSFAWSSGDSSVATVDRSGLVTAVSNGTAAIGAQAEDVSGAASLTVAQAASKVVVTPATDSVNLTDTVRLAAWATDANGYLIAGARFSWSSSKNWVARVDSSGLVVGAGHGRAVVTAELGSARGTSEIWVFNPDRAVLEALYHATGGPGWRNRHNWLSDAPLRTWHGVTTTGTGFVYELRLFNNGLSGTLPAEVGNLAYMRVLELTSNQGLVGPIPPELGKLKRLEELRLLATQVSGSIPPELGNMSSLKVLDLNAVPVTGSIPPELGNLKNLVLLILSGNYLSGEIPPELGKLSNLEWLFLQNNHLSGSIPPELGNLSRLWIMRMYRNNLSGPIPAEFEKLTNLWYLELNNNQLSGPLPSGLGKLTQLRDIYLQNNRLTGPLPPELGGLDRLITMRLGFNDLDGSIPSEFGEMGWLRDLRLTDNQKMSGTLPDSITKLRLSSFLAGRTGLCAPRDSLFTEWIKKIRAPRIAACEDATAYLTQAVQSRTHPVPLVADEKALLRVFVTATKKTSEGIPLVRARFYLDETEDTVVDIPGKSTPIPTKVDEGDLAKSANVEIPGGVVQPGLEMVIEIDPDDELDEDLLVTKRIPETGRMALDVREMPTLDLTMVPFLWTQDPDSAVLDATADMEEDPEEHELLSHTRTLLPVVDLDVEAHEAVESSSNYSWDLLSQTQATRSVEGGTGYWMGTITGRWSGPSGIGVIPGWTSFSILWSNLIAHELAHNMNLFHARCGGAGGPDPHYPRGDGSTGAWGYDFESESLVPPTHRDLMTYCVPRWISDYHFTKMVGHRLSHPQARRSPTTARSLLLWGGATPEGDLVLNPAIVVDAPTALPEADGDHRIAGLTADSTEIFSLDFDMPVISEGGSAFAFVLPLQPGWTDSLAMITLTGPDDETALTMDTDRPVAIVRDSRTGRVRAFLQGDAAVDARDGPSAERGLVVRFSRGIPDADAWLR